jgi:hypothetical protein
MSQLGVLAKSPEEQAVSDQRTAHDNPGFARRSLTHG